MSIEQGFVPPHSFESEQSVLGGLLYSGDKLADLGLVESDFYSRPHRLIFSAIQYLYSSRNPIDLMTVMSRMTDDGSIEAIGGWAYLAELMKITPSTANIRAYAETVRSHSQRRVAIAKLHEAIEAMVTTDLTNNDERFGALSNAISEIDSKRAGGVSGIAVPVSQIVGEWCDELDSRATRKPGDMAGVATGIPALDKLLYPKGISNSALVCIGARPKMGKTTVLANMCNHAALKRKLPVLVFSLEMTRTEIFEVMVSQASLVESQHFSTLSDQSLVDKGYAVAAELGHSKLFVADAPRITVQQVISEARRLRREHGQIGLIAVDYLTLMTAGKAERNDLAYGDITKNLKQLAKEMGCPVVLLTQLNRSLESRSDKRPMPSDSRDTGQIEQDCDVWIGIYRDEVYHEDSHMRGLMELIVRLNRGGKTGTAFCGFSNGLIRDISEQDVAAKVTAAEADSKSKANPRYQKQGASF